MATEPLGPDAPAERGMARFELAPPRRFLLPAVLLLLSERPGHGYGLVPRLAEFRFGRVDRPSVYRALAQLERDGLVEVFTEPSAQGGQGRRVYAVTPLGQRVLRLWMGVVREEHAHLGDVIRRYQSTPTVDAVLAEVEQGWTSEVDLTWSSVSTTSCWRRRLTWVASEGGHEEPCEHVARSEPPVHETLTNRFTLDPERSAVLVDARSTVGPISFGTVGVEGSLCVALVDGVVSTDVPPRGSLAIDVSTLSSGNKVYDAELHRRIDSRRFPTATVELCECTTSVPASRYCLQGELTFHGVTRRAEGTVSVETGPGDRLVISGEQVFDIRDFAVPSPTMLMLRIFPDVRVRLYAEARPRGA